MIEPGEINQERLTTASHTEKEDAFESSLRPKTLGDFVGQQNLKQNLEIFIQAAKSREEPLDHLLFHGNPGLGKTTLAHIIAKEMGAEMRVTSGPSLERVGDLAAILSNLSAGDILFIDEIHRMNRAIEEVLYPAMEDFALDLIVGKGPSARTLRLSLEPFTVIGATTRLSLLSSPLRDRFGAVHHIDFYADDEISEILARNATQLNTTLAEDACHEIARRARKTPRIANRLLKRVRDYAEVKGDGSISIPITEQALTLLDIDHKGLDAMDRHVLTTIIEKFDGGPVGLNTIAASTRQELETIEEVVEPFLLQVGLLQRTPRGRTATKAAYEHLAITPTGRLL